MAAGGLGLAPMVSILQVIEIPGEFCQVLFRCCHNTKWLGLFTG